MKLYLDHQGRVNISTMIGMLECRTIGETRSAWGLMDRLALNEEEKEAIEFRIETAAGGAQFPAWNPRKSLPFNEFIFDTEEAQQLVKALGAARFLPGPMRGWLEPVLAQLPVVETNGAH